MTTQKNEETLGGLVHQLSEQIPDLVRSEIRLAQAELAQTGKKAGLGAGLFGGAGLLALYGLGVLVAAAVLGLAVVLDAWLAAVIVAVVLFAAAGVVALVGKKEVEQAMPAAPEKAIHGVRADVATLKGDRV